ncbi:MAG: glutathione S-transferase C-terminal domain-containing protein [Pseudomonadota bacterium]
MDYTLFIGDRRYSSWSLRGWLLFDAFGIPCGIRYAQMKTDDFEAMKAEMAPSRLVPAMKLADDTVVWDSLAMAETLHERHPDAGIWPEEASQRAMARSLCAQMHSGFTALRGACPMNLGRAYTGFDADESVLADVSAVTELWAMARATSGDGPFLFGAFTAADAFFAPVASRITTYDLPVRDVDAAYIKAVLGHPSVRRWYAMSVAKPEHQAHYEFDHADRPNPMAPKLTGTVVSGPASAAENANCPYSGKAVADDCVVEISNRMIGYCNPFCAAKSAADPYAWPQTVALLEG